MTARGLKWENQDSFEQRFYTPLAAWVGNCPECPMVTTVLYGSCARHKIPKGTLIPQSTFQPHNCWRELAIYLELLHDTNIDALHMTGIPLICYQFWQNLLSNVNYVSQPDELNQQPLRLVKDLLNWLLKYLKSRNVRDQFDTWFTSVP